jgi:hypothetical protein
MVPICSRWGWRRRPHLMRLGCATVSAAHAPGCALSSPSRCAEQPSACAASEPPDAAPSEPPTLTRAGFCGDRRVDGGEQCDDGAFCLDGRECTNDRYRCQVGSTTACRPRGGDGCSDQCTIEAGYECTDGLSCRALAFAPDGRDTSDSRDAGRSPNAERASDASASGGGNCGSDGLLAPEPVVVIPAPPASVFAPSLSPDASILYFTSANAIAIERLFSATRTGENEFTNATPIAALNSGAGEGTPMAGPDGLSLYFYSARPGGAGDRDLWLAERSEAGSEFGAARTLGSLNSASLDHLPWLSANELTVLFVSTRVGGLGQSDVWIAQRAARGSGFDRPSPLAAINSSDDEGRAVMTRDGTTLFFSSTRPGGAGASDLWVATRSDPTSSFGEPLNLAILNGPARELDVALSADERELYFSSARGGPTRIWRSVRPCAE